MFRFAVIVLAFLSVAYSQVVSAQGALNDKAYRLFLARVTTFSNGMMSFSTTGVPLATSAPIVFSAPTFTAGGAAVTTASRVAVGAGSAAVSVVGSASGPAVFSAFRALTGGPLGLALLASPLIINWLSQGGVQQNPAPTPEKPFALVIQGWSGPRGGTYPSAQAACESGGWGPSMTVVYYWDEPNSARCSDGAGSNYARIEKIGSPSLTPASMNDIAPYMDIPTPPAVFKALLDAGAKIEVVPRFINGPEYVPLPTETSVTETPEKITTTEKQKGVKLEYKTATDPVTGQPAPYVEATPKETTTVKGKDKATGQEKVISVTETEGGDKPKSDPQEIETCGLPGKPKCLIDETGTPEPVTDDKYKPRLDDYRTKQKDLKDAASGVADKSFFSGWGAVFVTPPFAACVPYTLPRDMGVIDPCPVAESMRAVMAYIWALGGLWLCVRMIREVM